MNFPAIIALFAPIVFGLAVYIIYQTISPSITYDATRKRIKHYSIGLLALLFSGLGLLTMLIISISYADFDRPCGPDLYFCTKQELEHNIRMARLTLLSLAFVSSIVLSLILYGTLLLYHKVYAGYEKPKGKPKLDQDNEK